MKMLFVFLSFFALPQSFAQVSNAQIKGNFSEIAKLGRLQGGESLQNFSNNNVKGTRYFPEDWATGSITTNSGETIANGYVFLLDKQNQDLYVKEQNSSEVILLGKDQVKRFTIDHHTFLEGSQMGGEPGTFYEQLAGKENGIALYKLTKTIFIKANKQDIERIKRGDFEDEYKDDITYFIKTPTQLLKKIKLNENNLIKALPTESKRIKEYFNTHQNNEVDQDFISALINYLNV